MSLFGDKALLKLKDFLLECEKTNSKFDLFSGKYLVLKSGISVNDSTHGVARISKKGNRRFHFKSRYLLGCRRTRWGK